MDFVVIATYDNYIHAHIAMGRLEEDDINCWLKDENTVTLIGLLREIRVNSWRFLRIF